MNGGSAFVLIVTAILIILSLVILRMTSRMREYNLKKYGEPGSRQSALADYTGIGVFDIDIVSGNTFVSSYGYEMIEKEEGTINLLDNSFYSIVHPDDLTSLLEQWKAFSAGEKGNEKTVTFRVRMSGGDYMTVAAEMHVLKRKDGVPVRVGGVFHDVTTIRELKDTLEVVSSKQNMLSSMTHHEIKMQNLAVKTGIAEISDIIPDTDEARGVIRSMNMNLSRMEKVLNYSGECLMTGDSAYSWHNLESLIRSGFKEVFPDGDAVLTAEGVNVEIYTEDIFHLVMYSIFINGKVDRAPVSKYMISFEEKENGEGWLTIEDDGKPVPQFRRDALHDLNHVDFNGCILCVSKTILHLTNMTLTERGEGCTQGAHLRIVIPKGMWRRTY